MEVANKEIIPLIETLRLASGQADLRRIYSLLSAKLRIGFIRETVAPIIVEIPCSVIAKPIFSFRDEPTLAVASTFTVIASYGRKIRLICIVIFLSVCFIPAQREFEWPIFLSDCLQP